MIVRTFSDRLELITQPDHAHLARAIMEHCVPLGDQPRRDAILLAISEHDGGWSGPDAAPTVNVATGRVFDFVNAPTGVRQAVWPRSIAALEGDSWAAALVAQHALTVYDRLRSDREWTSFFDDIETARAALLRSAGLPLGDLVADYTFVRLADLISLAFCSGSIDEQRFDAFTVRLHGTRVVVTPDVFGGAVIPFAIEAKVISSRPFQADDELRRALREASAAILRGDVSGR
jgi:Protein of unknown function (DUF3891)